MESIYTGLALYGSKNECARTDNVFFLKSEVCDGMVSLMKFWNADILKCLNTENLKWQNFEMLKYLHTKTLKYCNSEMMEFGYAEIPKYWNYERIKE